MNSRKHALPPTGSAYTKTVLDSGLTVLSEKLNTVRSVTVGVWIKIGSRFERVGENGLSHFLEHMMFKGTPKRTPFNIARSLESLGGSLNAFTGKEVTCYLANVQDIHLNRSIEVLSDMVCHSTFPEKEIQREQMVIIEEINSIKDIPEEYIFDIFSEKIFPADPLGCPVIGREENIVRFNRDMTVDFWRQHYHPTDMVISAAGNLEHQQLVSWIQKYFVLNGTTTPKRLIPVTAAKSQAYVFQQPINQAHICIGGGCCSYSSADRLPLQIINTYLGGGMSSCLFQNLREKKGLVYNVYSFIDFFSDIGVMGVYAAADPKKINTVQHLLLDELSRFRKKLMSAKNLKMVKNQLQGNLVLALESTSSRMSRLAKNEMYYSDYVPVDSLLKQIDLVSLDEIKRVADIYINPTDFISVTFQPAN
jgi:predicted Zn-dependent peptidase